MGISFIVMFLSSFIPNMLWRIFGDGQRPELLDANILLFLGFITVFLTISLFSFLIERIFVRRLSILNRATKEVMKGNYQSEIIVLQNDEISDLIMSFNKMTKSLRSNEYLNKEFVRNFSHELKTPLSAIKGYADLIDDPNTSTEDIKDYAKIISNEANRLSSLSKNMLQVSLVDAQNIIAKNDTFNVAEQIRNVIQLMQLDWEKKNIELNIDMEEIEITSNEEFTFQVWTNLISNAIRFSKDNSQIQIKLEELGDTIRFDIINQGHILKEDQEKIFDLFYVAKESRTNQSSGVGLTLTKKIIKKLGGDISFTSENELVTFTVNLSSY